ncbi:AraC family transcriptional regulator [Spirosoma sp. BT702]|uniref:AraC family transcriptional regulator n=1 Tax=Spirosoma profusum TaxID=2771354 RepID=A0A927AQC1_9BACT|nr:helix-turn-helix domain-containing protein [Spirosoma profusum]MBD2700093.1 AraC family transcriptional regulator [Spirosoma profusum]
MLTKNIVLVLSCLGIAQALLLSIYLFSLRDKKANLFLALMLLGLILRISHSVVTNYIRPEPWIRILGISGLLLIGPFLWFYGKALFEKKGVTTSEYGQLIPFGLVVLLCRLLPNGADFVSYAIASLVFLHLAVYLIVCWMYLLKSLPGARLLPWYRTIVIGVSVIWFVYVGIFIGLIPLYILGAVIFSLLIYLFSFLLLKRHVFALEKYGTSSLDQVASTQLLQQIEKLFETKEIYLDPTISVNGVAQLLSTSPRQLSQVINEQAQMNFSGFVNQYRIAKAKILLADPAYFQEKIQTIAYDCGFGNVTSFNLAFKAQTRLTPSQYRRQGNFA